MFLYLYPRRSLLYNHSELGPSPSPVGQREANSVKAIKIQDHMIYSEPQHTINGDPGKPLQSSINDLSPHFALGFSCGLVSLVYKGQGLAAGRRSSCWEKGFPSSSAKIPRLNWEVKSASNATQACHSLLHSRSWQPQTEKILSTLLVWICVHLKELLVSSNSAFI